MQTYPGQTDTPTPSANQTQVYRALLHQDSMTLQNADIPSVDVPPNQTHLYRALLHQDSMTLQNADVPNANVPPTPSVQTPTTSRQYDIAECRCTQCQSTLQSPLMKPSATET